MSVLNNLKVLTMKFLSFITILGFFQLSFAQNPIIQTNFTADPAPMVYQDKVYLYVGVDEPNAPKNSYLMREYRLFTTSDMVNWTDNGAVLKTSEVLWANGDANAAQVIERNGKFYYYISTGYNHYPGGIAVGVLVSDSPYGPFKDVLGKPLVTNQMTTYASHSWDDLDPSVFIDDDGQAYLFWGNGACYWAKLNDDMISLDGEINFLDIKDPKQIVGRFTEAPWIFKRNKIYYLLYASQFPEEINYSTSNKITGSWKIGGKLMATEKGSNTNHSGIIDYKGNSYFFYHNDALPGGHSYDRSVAVEQFQYNKDGSIPTMTMTDNGIVKGVGTLNPYQKTQAETIAFSKGVKAVEDNEKRIFITEIHNGDYIKVRDVDFGSDGVSQFTANASSRYNGGIIEIRTDSIEGKLLGTLKINYTGEWNYWKEFTTTIESITGVHDLYFIFKGKEPYTLFNFDYWKFLK